MDGKRTQTTRRGGKCRHFYTGLTKSPPTGYPQVLVEYVGDGPSRKRSHTYAYGLDLISQRRFNPANEALLAEEFSSTDALGSTRFLSRFDPGNGGAIDGHLGELTTKTFIYDAYGLPATDSSISSGIYYLYSGEQWDPELRAYYLRARWYLPEWGRFLSRDSYEGTDDDPVSQNRFLYTHANPVNHTDPSGMMTMTEAMTSVQTQVRQYATHTVSVVRGYKQTKRVLCGGGRVAFTTTAVLYGGHHTWPKFMGGPRAQRLAKLHVELHRILHRLLDQFVKDDPILREMSALGGATGSRQQWMDKFAEDPKAQKRANELLRKATKAIDKFCKFKKPTLTDMLDTMLK